MFARVVAIFGEEYREIGHLIGECNREIDQIRGTVTREFPINASKRAIDACFGAFLRVFYVLFGGKFAPVCGLSEVRCQVPGVSDPGDRAGVRHGDHHRMRTEARGNRLRRRFHLALVPLFCTSR